MGTEHTENRQRTDNKQLARIPDIVLEKLDRTYKDKVEELRVALCEFDGKRYAGIRVFWKTKDGEWAPGKQGVTIRAKELGKVIDALKTIKEELESSKIEKKAAGDAW